jgi:hypothetical protein
MRGMTVVVPGCMDTSTPGFRGRRCSCQAKAVAGPTAVQPSSAPLRLHEKRKPGGAAARGRPGAVSER